MPVEFRRRFASESSDVLAAILDQSQDCIKLVNPDGELEYMNANGMKAMAIEDFSAVAQAKWSSLWPEESRARVEKALERACAGATARFDGYCPTAAGAPRWWDVSLSPVRANDGSIRHVLVVSRDITGAMQERLSDRLRREEAEREADRSEDIAREMRHRLKNLLAVVASLTRMVARNSDSPDEMVTGLEERIRALSAAQDLLARKAHAPIGADEAVREILAASGGGELEVRDIPDVPIGDQAVQQLALVLGELTTNSLKYGALSAGRGHVVLTGNALGDAVSFHWHEDCGRDIAEPQRQGAGTLLISRLGSAPGLPAKIAWHATGPSVQFHVARSHHG